MSGLDQRRFAHAPRAPQQGVVGRQAARKSLGVLKQKIAHAIDALEERHLDTVDAGGRRRAGALRMPDKGRGRGRNRARAAVAEPDVRARRRSARRTSSTPIARRARWRFRATAALAALFLKLEAEFDIAFRTVPPSLAGR